MAKKLTEQDGKEALQDHVAQKAIQARVKCGLYVDAEAIIRLLGDREVVRFPVEVAFSKDHLHPGEFAIPQQKGENPRDGFWLFIHPHFENMPDAWPLIIAYHIPTINYGDVATSDDAEHYGAALNGLDVETYYQTLCDIADSIPEK